jgi:hypothetical protein
MVTTMTSFSAAVADALSSSAPPGQQRYLLVDAAAFLGTLARLPIDADLPATDLLTQQVVNDWRDCASPLLLPLPAGTWKSSTLAVWKSFGASWRYANALTYLETGLQPSELTGALAARLHVKLPQGVDAMLRYFDNRVMTALPTVLDPGQRRALFRPAQRWLHADRSGNVCAIHGDNARDEPQDLYSLTLNDAQEAALLDVTAADAVIDQLLVQSHPKLLTMRPDQQHLAISAALVRAVQYGLTGNPDQVAYCNLALTYGPDFEHQEPWKALLMRASAGQVTFSEGLRHVAAGELA